MLKEGEAFEEAVVVEGPGTPGNPFQGHTQILSLPPSLSQLQKEASHRQLPSAIGEDELPSLALLGSYFRPLLSLFYAVLTRACVNSNCYPVLPLTTNIYS